MVLILQTIRQASHLLALSPPLIREQKWQNEHFISSHAEVSSKTNSYQAEK